MLLSASLAVIIRVLAMAWVWVVWRNVSSYLAIGPMAACTCVAGIHIRVRIVSAVRVRVIVLGFFKVIPWRILFG